MFSWLAQKSTKKIYPTTRMIFGLSISFSDIRRRGHK